MVQIILDWLAVVCLVSVGWPIRHLWLAMRRTALRSACAWVAVALGVWLAAALAAALESRPGSWVATGHLRLLAATCSLCPLIAVLGARWPGARAWNLIVASLLVIFALPVLQQWLLGRTLERDRVGMDGPRFAFYWLVAAVGLVNYLPTRFGLSAVIAALALAAQTVAVGPWEVSPAMVSVLSAVSGLLVSGLVWLAFALRPKTLSDGPDAAWLSLRDGWGAVWALRVRDRWNAAAAHYGWPWRLDWSGFQHIDPQAERRIGSARPTPQTGPVEPTARGPRTLDPAAEEHFRYLLQRFTDPHLWFRANQQSARPAS